MRFRILETTRRRLSDAAKRHGATSAEVVRRSVRHYLRSGRVNLDEYKKECTRTESVVITAAGLDSRTAEGLRLDSVINWYLDQKDDGSTSAVPRMDPEDLIHNRDGSVTYTGVATMPQGENKKKGRS